MALWGATYGGDSQSLTLSLKGNNFLTPATLHLNFSETSPAQEIITMTEAELHRMSIFKLIYIMGTWKLIYMKYAD